MYFLHSPKIWEEYPELVAGTLVVRGIHPEADTGADIGALNLRVLERLGTADEGQMPEIDAWRRVYSKMGLKPTQYRCAAESLLRRYRKDRSLPRFHPLVDLCNALSMAFAIPIAVYDAAQITGGIEVRHAKGDEQHLSFSGEMEIPEAGEVIFADEERHAHSRRWCFRQSKKSVVTAQTETALIVAEAHHQKAGDDVQALITMLAGQCAQHWQAPEQSVILTSGAPRLEWN
ncbi:MAG: hypothetical protein HOO67_02630 [Candidatus Peribacteraceae bacterium]|nr:hypothetical protein [Candidatus Peribacteraceae bacterium]